MNRFKILVAVFAFSLLALSLPEAASAQWRNDDYYGNNRNNRNLQATIKNLKNRSKQFERRIDRELDRSRYNDRRTEDMINNLSKDFARAADRLEDRYDNRGDFNRSRNEAQRVLQLGSQLDNALRRVRLSNNVGSEWNRIRQDLQVISSAYGGYYNDNRNRRGNSGDWRNNIPFPFPF